MNDTNPAMKRFKRATTGVLLLKLQARKMLTYGAKYAKNVLFLEHLGHRGHYVSLISLLTWRCLSCAHVSPGK
jgi:hypothetical protein